MGPAFRRLLPYLTRYRRTFSFGLLFVVITTAIQLLPPWVLKYAVDDLNAGVTVGKLVRYAAIIFGIACVGAVFRFLMRRVIIGASREIEYDLRNAFFARLQQMPLGYYQSRRTGELMSRATNDLNAVRMMIGPAVMYTANTILVFVVAILMMATIDVRLTLIALVPLPLVSVTVHYFGRVIHQRFEVIQAQLAEVSAMVQESLSGVRVVRAYAQEEHEIERFRAANVEYVARNRALIVLQGMFYPSMTFFLGVGSLLVLWKGGEAVISRRITLGEFFAFNSYLALLAWPMIAFGWVTNILQRGMASWGRMLEVMDAAPAISDAAVTPLGEALDIRGQIDVRGLTFTYPGSESPVLRDVSCTIPAGTTAAFIGATGSCSRGSRLTSRRPAPYSSTAWTFVRSRCRGCAARSGSSRRSRFCSRQHSPRTSSSPAVPTSHACWRRHPSRGSTRTSSSSPRAMRRRSASAGSRCREGRNSGPQSREPSLPIRGSWSWTTRCRRLTPTPRTRSSRGCGESWRYARH